MSWLRLLASALVPALVQTQDATAEQRAVLIRELKERIRNAAVISAMASTPRHEFVPEALRKQAYWDIPLPIGYRATISQPYVVALMTELLEPRKTDRVLEIGTGSGYQAAVLSPLVAEVYSIEIVPELAASAKERLERLKYRNIIVKQGDGYVGWPSKAPFDSIILTAAPPEVPQMLIDQLKAGGRLVCPVGKTDQELVVVEKGKDGKVSTKRITDVRFVPMVRK